jgi:hypothetical protein
VDDTHGRFHPSRPVFAFAVQGGFVVEAAPIARRRLLRERSWDVFTELDDLGLLAEPIPG